MNNLGEREPARRSIRLKGYDYRLAGGYFVTICVKDGECLLGEVVRGLMELNEIGSIVNREWQNSGDRRTRVELDTYQVMPNHFHGIIWLLNEPEREPMQAEQGSNRARQATPLPVNPRGAKSGSLAAVIGGFKSGSTRHINKYRGITGESVWQRNYWERIIRNERELEAIRMYIWNNPANWNKDQLHPQNLGRVRRFANNEGCQIE